MINEIYLFYFEAILFFLIIYEVYFANNSIYYPSIFDLIKFIKKIKENKKNKK